MEIVSAGPAGVALSFSRAECPELFDPEGCLMPAAARFFAVRALNELGRPASPLSLGTTAYIAGDQGLLFAQPCPAEGRELFAFADFSALASCAAALPEETPSSLLLLAGRYYLWLAPGTQEAFSALLEFGRRVDAVPAFLSCFKGEGKVLMRKRAVAALRPLA